MPEFVKTCLIVLPLIFLGGFVDSVAGGGGLITLPAYLMAGLPAHLAIGTNKVVNGCGTAVASARYLRGGKVQLRPALIAAAAALLGASIGSKLALLIPEDVLKLMMLVALPIIAVFLAVKKDLGMTEDSEKEVSLRREIVGSVLIGLLIGCYDGMIGPGTGTFMIMAFTMTLGMDLLTASGCSKLANLASNVGSAVMFISAGKVYWMLALPAALCNILGAVCGTRYAMRGGSRRVRGMIFVVLSILVIKMVSELFF